MAARAVRRSRRIGSTRKVVCSHIPVRTRGSASSIKTKLTPPIKRDDTESGDTSAASPGGRKKSTEDRSPRSNSSCVATSRLLCNGQGRMIGIVTATKFPQTLLDPSFCCLRLSITSSSSSSDRGEIPSVRNPGRLSEAIVSICISST
jgi:hypothetical protein